MSPELMKMNSSFNKKQMERVGHNIFDFCPHRLSCKSYLQLPHPKLKIMYPQLPPFHLLCSKITPPQNLNVFKCTDGQESVICAVDFTRAMSKSHPKSQHGKAECCLHAWPWNIKAITLVMCRNTSCALTKSNQML